MIERLYQSYIQWIVGIGSSATGKIIINNVDDINTKWIALGNIAIVIGIIASIVSIINGIMVICRTIKNKNK